MTASTMSPCDFENSQISAQDSVGVAGDDIMYHFLTLVTFPGICESKENKKTAMPWMKCAIWTILEKESTCFDR